MTENQTSYQPRTQGLITTPPATPPSVGCLAASGDKTLGTRLISYDEKLQDTTLYNKIENSLRAAWEVGR